MNELSPLLEIVYFLTSNITMSDGIIPSLKLAFYLLSIRLFQLIGVGLFKAIGFSFTVAHFIFCFIFTVFFFFLSHAEFFSIFIIEPEGKVIRRAWGKLKNKPKPTKRERSFLFNFKQLAKNCIFSKVRGKWI